MKKVSKNKDNPKTGRPKSAITRQTRLPVRVSEEELQALRNTADRSGVSLAAHVRKRLGLPGTGYGDSQE